MTEKEKIFQSLRDGTYRFVVIDLFSPIFDVFDQSESFKIQAKGWVKYENKIEVRSSWPENVEPYLYCLITISPKTETTPTVEEKSIIRFFCRYPYKADNPDYPRLIIGEKVSGINDREIKEIAEKLEMDRSKGRGQTFH